jgi:hypothetical protein
MATKSGPSHRQVVLLLSASAPSALSVLDALLAKVIAFMCICPASGCRVLAFSQLLCATYFVVHLIFLRVPCAFNLAFALGFVRQYSFVIVICLQGCILLWLRVWRVPSDAAVV